ncbi:MAG: hypothetical protein J5J00_02000 [Deltaproteobacteria bacterium]|nr:hypothetical protein [Deltaproteobacteria bacterium]
MHKPFTFAAILFSLLALPLCLSGCEDRGPLEEAGREIDDAVGDARDNEGLADETGDALRELGDDVEDQG